MLATSEQTFCCKKCNQNKRISDFVGLDLANLCKSCNAEKGRNWRAANREKYRLYSNARARQEYPKRLMYLRNQRYGISPKMVDDLLKSQSNNCAICAQSIENKFCVDHCHKTGKVRGLLCNGCNTAIGMVKENLSTLQNAINYLVKHG